MNAIPFACSCGKRLLAKPALAGHKVKCPACAAVTIVPTPPAVAPTEAREPTATPDGATGEKVCPDCLATVPASVVICVHCGLDFRTGKHMSAGQKH